MSFQPFNVLPSNISTKPDSAADADPAKTDAAATKGRNKRVFMKCLYSEVGPAQSQIIHARLTSSRGSRAKKKKAGSPASSSKSQFLRECESVAIAIAAAPASTAAVTTITASS